jgi:hypothetical protein
MSYPKTLYMIYCMDREQKPQVVPKCNDRHIDYVRLPPCAVLQPSLAKWRLLHTTRIAVECDRARSSVTNGYR